MKKKLLSDNIEIYNFPRKFIMNIENIPVTVERKWIKTIRLSISGHDASVHLSAPAFMTDERIKEFLLARVDWLRENVKRFKEQIEQRTIHYNTGDKLTVFGQTRLLTVIEVEKPPKVVLGDNDITLYCRARFDENKRKAILREWYRKQLYAILPPIIAKWETILKVKTSGFKVNLAQTLWGSCNIRTHDIHFSINLAKKPMRCIEYVVAHELTHLIVIGHNKKFYSILDGYFEDAAEIKLLLKKKEIF